MSLWHNLRLKLGAFLFAFSLNLDTAAQAAAISSSVLKTFGNNQLQLTINLRQWSSNFNYSVVLPASGSALLVQSRQCVVSTGFFSVVVAHIRMLVGTATLATKSHAMRLLCTFGAGFVRSVSARPVLLSPVISEAKFWCLVADLPIFGTDAASSYWTPTADIIVTLNPTNASSVDRRCALARIQALSSAVLGTALRPSLPMHVAVAFLGMKRNQLRHKGRLMFAGILPVHSMISKRQSGQQIAIL